MERRSNPRRVERKLENFYVLQPVRPVGSTIVESDEKRGHKKRRIHLPLHPTEVLMNEFNGRLTDSGQVVTDQIIPFSKIKGGWIQNSKAAWDRLIVKSGDEQVVRIGRVQSSIVATKESLLRLAKQCLSVEEQPYDELTMDAMSLIDKFENHLIPEGGKEQYEGRIRLVDYILEKNRSQNQGAGTVLTVSRRRQLSLPFVWHAGQRSRVMA